MLFQLDYLDQVGYDSQIRLAIFDRLGKFCQASYISILKLIRVGKVIQISQDRLIRLDQFHPTSDPHNPHHPQGV